MNPEELVINFINNKYHGLTIFMVEISMQQGPNQGVTEKIAKNTINFKLRSKFNYYKKQKQIYI